jgi:hypothetical protein
MENINHNKAAQINDKPTFNHSEINALYENDFHIDREILKELLALPQESLIEDLETVLQDCINRYEYFCEVEEEGSRDPHKFQFPLHALFLLADLEAEESLPAVLNLLRQEDELLDFWLGDHLTESYWRVIYHLGQHKLPELTAFLKEPDNDTFERHAIPSAMQQIALHQPERKAEIVEWYQDIFDFFLKNKEDDRIIDIELIGFMVSDCIEINATELTDIIELLFQNNLVETFVTGSWQSVKEDLSKKSRFSRKCEIFDDICDYYDHILKTWGYYRSEEDQPSERSINNSFSGPSDDDMVYKDDISQTFVRKDEKVGRNDPCPCGSGKKYKHCCMN